MKFWRLVISLELATKFKLPFINDKQTADGFAFWVHQLVSVKLGFGQFFREPLNWTFLESSEVRYAWEEISNSQFLALVDNRQAVVKVVSVKSCKHCVRVAHNTRLSCRIRTQQRKLAKSWACVQLSNEAVVVAIIKLIRLAIDFEPVIRNLLHVWIDEVSFQLLHNFIDFMFRATFIETG